MGKNKKDELKTKYSEMQKIVKGRRAKLLADIENFAVSIIGTNMIITRYKFMKQLMQNKELVLKLHKHGVGRYTLDMLEDLLMDSKRIQMIDSKNIDEMSKNNTFFPKISKSAIYFIGYTVDEQRIQAINSLLSE